MRRAVNVPSSTLQDSGQSRGLRLRSTQHRRAERTLLRLQVSQGPPARVPGQNESISAVLIVPSIRVLPLLLLVIVSTRTFTTLLLRTSVLRNPVLIGLLQHWQSHRPQARLEGQVRVIIQQTREEESRQGVHWHRFRVNGHPESTGRTSIHHLNGAVLQHAHKEQVQVNVLQSGDQLILLLADHVLGVETLWHNPLLAQCEDCRLESQSQVCLILVLRVRHVDVLILRRHDRGICCILGIAVAPIGIIPWPTSVGIISAS